jgi:hypothetical protein
MASEEKRSVTGTVLSLHRGRADGTLENDLVSLVIEADSGNHAVDLPIPTRTALELIPYELALKGACVKYEQTLNQYDDGTAETWTLAILSGPLGGQRYES